ncbi:MBL fold metallo-hydrolase [Thermomonospora curvata]|uniref:Beta-lactamase domain protein n=1 Tax=Thermomonospora curvata (strain ATCC 19995 / DSM 43183 / JCM 3096 / KCTC 9072 / NBRC 15933 / NCIMB 10081 / Henssen B9) TaxID=471852 RepID=D1A1P1_THECD|nr:MBL fold metallo-hydrolase [Thermomonospora curvata]ACY97729.1 beta-lactamase domain protein [Thermomonospora curvata DSM 43183]
MSTQSLITPLGDEVYEIDTQLAGHPGITAGYLIRSDRPCLVEPGTSGSAPTVRRALTELGIGPRDLATVVVTHIHLDHAGGVGDIARMYPQAEIVVHEKGARHLADPQRLMRSARMVYGDLLDTLFGELKPTEAARIRAVEETGVIDLGGGRRLQSHYSPGHAKHHIGLLDSLTGDLYVGDAAGVYIPETADVRPATPPPDFDLDTALASLEKFRALRPQRLLFAHYGPVEAVEDTLDRSAEELRIWVEAVRDARDQGLDLDHAVAAVQERTAGRYRAYGPDADPELAGKYEMLSGVRSNVAGIMHSLDKHA